MGVITVAAVQAAPLPAAGLPVFGQSATLDAFGADTERVRAQIAGPALLVYPELHLFGTDHSDEHRDQLLQAAAQPLDGELITQLGMIARGLDAWLIPGSIYERTGFGEIFNTALMFSPDGGLAGSYRKIFPWRPYEWSTPGNRFVAVTIPDIGCVGLSVCYDAWFPEVGRHLAWMGADLVINLVKTVGADRPHELVLARANSIVNQVFTLSVNTAGPVGRGRSIIVDPEGAVLDESPDEAPGVFIHLLDLSLVQRVRDAGTAGTNRMWAQFRAADRVIDLPLYGGRIDPRSWSPQRSIGGRGS
jgi:predicted amidohydrolase